MALKKVREDLIVGLIGRGETEQEYSSGLYLFAATCLETSLEEPGLNVKLKVEHKINTLQPLKSAKDALHHYN